MADRSTAPGRIALMGLVVAGAMAGMAGTASAQYYYCLLYTSRCV